MNNFIIYVMCLGVLPVCMSVHFVQAGYPRGPEEVISSLGLELKVVVSRHVCAGN